MQIMTSQWDELEKFSDIRIEYPMYLCFLIDGSWRASDVHIILGCKAGKTLLSTQKIIILKFARGLLQIVPDYYY